MPRIKLTKAAVDSLSLSAHGQRIYRDSALPGFGICVGVACKSYFAEKRVGGRSVRVTLGHHPLVGAEQARRLALRRLSEMAQGIGPDCVTKGLAGGYQDA